MDRVVLAERLAVARDRYPIYLGPLFVLFALGISASSTLAWVAGVLLALLTLNKLLPWVAGRR